MPLCIFRRSFELMCFVWVAFEHNKDVTWKTKPPSKMSTVLDAMFKSATVLPPLYVRVGQNFPVKS